jgi:hypothetical protein
MISRGQSTKRQALPGRKLVIPFRPHRLIRSDGQFLVGRVSDRVPDFPLPTWVRTVFLDQFKEHVGIVDTAFAKGTCYLPDPWMDPMPGSGQLSKRAFASGGNLSIIAAGEDPWFSPWLFMWACPPSSCFRHRISRALVPRHSSETWRAGQGSNAKYGRASLY